MTKLRRNICSLVSQPYGVPLLFLLVTVLAYGLSFWRLGLYWDDQPISWIRYQLGTEATTRYFSDSRPVWALLYQITGFLLPLKPAYWQVFAMFWRWAGVVLLWLIMLRVVPRRRDLALFLPLLVLLYPGFNQQWVSYLYSHFFIVLCFLLASWLLMLYGWTLPAMILSALQLLMFEYFFLLELMRPVILFLALSEESLPRAERWKRTLRAWVPYLGVILFVLLYRALVYSHPGFGYSLTEELARAPMETIAELLRQMLSSLWAAAAGAWTQAFQLPSLAVNGLRTSLLYLAVVAAAGVLVYLWRERQGATAGHRRDALWLIGLGAVMLLLGGVPYWVTNLPVTLSFPANRALLSFMFGACLLLLGLLDLLPARGTAWLVILTLALSTGRQFLWSVDYLRDWQSQKNLFWQMSWRAPALQPNTLVLMNEELAFSADNSISAHLNWIYAPQNRSEQIEYLLFYPTNRLEASLPAMRPELPIQYDFLAGQFRGSTSQAVAFYYDPPACLRLLEADLDSENRFLLDESLMRAAAALSDESLILPEPVAHMPDIYGPEPEHGWCYHFQKADLARQLGDWEEVVRLGEIAFELGDHPNNPVERFPFIEGYAHTGGWEQAVRLSQESYQVSKGYVGPLLCKLWNRIEAETTDDAPRAAALSEVKTMLACKP